MKTLMYLAILLLASAAWAGDSYGNLTCTAAQDTLNSGTAVTYTFPGHCYGFVVYNWSSTAILISIDGSTYPVRVEQYGDTAGLFLAPPGYMPSEGWLTIKMKAVGTNTGYVSVVSWCD